MNRLEHAGSIVIPKEGTAWPRRWGWLCSQGVRVVGPQLQVLGWSLSSWASWQTPGSPGVGGDTVVGGVQAGRAVLRVAESGRDRRGTL